MNLFELILKRLKKSKYLWLYSLKVVLMQMHFLILMAAKIEGIEIFKQKEIQEPTNVDYSLNVLVDQSESEITWIKLHQMFDK